MDYQVGQLMNTPNLYPLMCNICWGGGLALLSLRTEALLYNPKKKKKKNEVCKSN